MNFACYEVEDKTGDVVFSRELGNARSIRYSIEAPKSNYLWAGGSGEDADRIFYSWGDTGSMTAYGMIEAYRDAKKVDSLADLQAEIIEQLAKDTEQFVLEVELLTEVGLDPVDDYWVGDRVTVDVNGQSLKNVIREATVKLEANKAPEYSIVVGTPDYVPTGIPRLYNKTRNNISRLSAIERRT